MTRDILDINDFTILVEESQGGAPGLDACAFDEPVIAVAFYGDGDVLLNVRYGDQVKSFEHTKGMALSFYADTEVIFEHNVSPQRPLQCLVIATAVRNLSQLPHQEGEIFQQLLHELVNPQDHYVEGPLFLMSPEMLHIIDQVFVNRFEGKTKMMFFRSQMTGLLAHFFGHLAENSGPKIKDQEQAKLFEAQKILQENLEAPPSLSELSRMIGLNSFKLKKNFKELFGVPVFKYLQEQRLTKAHQLITTDNYSVQEAAWQVGYDSLSSFSKAFAQKYGFRPSQIKR